MEEAFPYYFSIGMTYEQYWDASPHLVCAYRQADAYKQDRYSQEAWLQGLYIYNAFGAVISNAFGGKGSKKAEYFREPIRFREKTKAEIAQEAEQKRQEIIKRLEQLGGGNNGSNDSRP